MWDAKCITRGGRDTKKKNTKGGVIVLKAGDSEMDSSHAFNSRYGLIGKVAKTYSENNS